MNITESNFKDERQTLTLTASLSLSLSVSLALCRSFPHQISSTSFRLPSRNVQPRLSLSADDAREDECRCSGRATGGLVQNAGRFSQVHQGPSRGGETEFRRGLSRYLGLLGWLHEHCHGADRGVCKWSAEEQVW